jgi:hypothetical protein
VCGNLPLPPAVTPLRPMRGAYTGSASAPVAAATLRPQLVWSASDTQCGPLTYQVMLDDSCQPGALDACAFASPEVDARVTLPQFQPAAALPVESSIPVGALYAWRVRACDAAERCSSWSSVAYLHVGRTQQDINGDGFADVIVNAAGVQSVFFGSANFDLSADAELSTTAQLRHVGDVNADGFGDLAALLDGQIDCGTFNAVPGVIYGGPDVTELQQQSLCGLFGTGSVAFHLGNVGDMNGDGYADLPILRVHFPPRFQLALGGPRVSAVPALDIEVEVPLADGTGNVSYAYGGTRPFDGAGDFNGDGYPDFLLSGTDFTDTPDSSASRSRQRLFFGAPTLPTNFAGTIDSTCEGREVVRIGDTDTDDREDWAVLCGAGQAGLLLGAGSAPTQLSRRLTARADLEGISRALDLDGDGRREVLLLSSTTFPLLWRGGNSVPEQLALPIGGLPSNADHNGDGRDDLLLRSGWISAAASLNLTALPLPAGSSFVY